MTNPSETRKSDHIELAFKSRADELMNDKRFYYEPLLSAHPVSLDFERTFLGKKLKLPLWISSMTGGTQKAGAINQNLARACNEFGIGMGLGSCRMLLDNDNYFEDFNLRPIIGTDLPFFANLGIAQVEKLLLKKEINKITDLVGRLKADGLIIHVNPLQEFLQPEGDRFKMAPIAVIESVLSSLQLPIIVKEVGQGMGPESLRALLQLPLAAIDFGAYGGTNFSKLELMRSDEKEQAMNSDLSYIGHTAEEMTGFVNQVVADLKDAVKCREVIVSGGIKNYLDGYYCINRLQLNAIYAQGSAFLKHAQNSYKDLQAYIKSQAEGLALCRSYLRVR